MADDNRYRAPRASDPHARASAGLTEDPLAELARLIGRQSEAGPSYRQSDPRDPYVAVPQDSGEQAAYQEPYRGHYADPYASQEQAPSAPYSQGYEGSRQDRGGGYGDARHDFHYGTGAQYTDPNYGYSPQPGEPGYVDPYQADQYAHDPRYAAPQGYANPTDGYGQGQYADQSGYQHYGDQQGYADQYQQHGSYDPAVYGQQPYGQSPYGQMPQAVTRPLGEEAGGRRRGGLVTVLAVLALAVVGTATAFGYRAMFTDAGPAVPPPVIKADVNPSKVVPATDPNAKPIQDRVGGAAEKIVSREEKPLDMRAGAGGSGPRAVLPNPYSQGSSTGNAEPKKVKTVTIKPEQGGDAAASAAPRTPASRPSTPATVDDILNGAGANASANAPLALSPSNPQARPQPQSQPQQQQQQQLASRTPAAGSPFPAPITSNGGAAGAYAVQVTSQRSEADAQASYKALQQQFPAVLGSRQATIRRADLGTKGTYYRAQIGFNTQGEASDFCGSLKTAGGQCVVQKN